tara:strand:+ start:1118681 stop:1120075 length:1395 start_codon:yes stop_codon:yes gene_type:complete
MLLMSSAYAEENSVGPPGHDAWQEYGWSAPDAEESRADNAELATDAGTYRHATVASTDRESVTRNVSETVNGSSASGDRGWDLHGALTQGFTGNPNQPANGLNRPVVFNDRANQYLLNQLYISAEHHWLTRSSWRFRSQVDLNYGYDSQFISVSGLERHKNRGRKWNSDTEHYGIAVPQLFGTIESGGDQSLQVKLGHFYSEAGFESVVAGENPFYSHSYVFSYGTPFTFTGVSASYQFDSRLTAITGFSQGWDSWSNDAGSWNLQFGLRYDGGHADDFLQVLLLTGEDLKNTLSDGVAQADIRNSIHVIYKRRLSDSIFYVADGTLGYQRDAIAVVDLGSAVIGFDSAKWFGIAQYLLCELAPGHTAGVRIDWFQDRDDSRIGTPVRFEPGGDVLLGGNFLGLTIGSQHRIFPNVTVRPELRWDRSDSRGNPDVPGGDSSIRAYGDRTDASQITLAADITIQF